ncbi:hypothetical protein CL656_05700 [bacterium]|nr:hypothetical protein [bacterium]|tara:strand:+ start:137 stop:1528 length:1392 start_codon:yes stop_codon:yes gene_type:complete
MTDSFYPSKTGILWLNSILQKRISCDLNLRLAKEEEFKWIISASNSEKHIIVYFNPFLYSIDSSKDLPFSNAFISNQFFTTKFTELPAPGLEKKVGNIISKNKKGLSIYYDILGITYCMLSRLEELNTNPEIYDMHQRFPSIESNGYKHRYLEEPIVDQWLFFLKECCEYCFSELKIIKHNFSICPTHDVDRPAKFSLVAKRNIIKNLGLDLLKSDSIFGALRSLKAYKDSAINVNNYLDSKDPFDTFKWIINENSKNNLKSEFYFMAQKNFHWRYDTGYKIYSPFIKKLIKFISNEGHLVGVHPGYNTFLDQNKFSSEVDFFLKTCESIGIHQKEWGGRMHYLRFRWPNTIGFWAESKFSYDATMGYADRPGFRCGTCHEYQIYDHQADKILDIREKPLIVMEASIISRQCLNLGIGDEALNYLISLKEKCKKVDGKFTFLWHNCQFENLNDRILYQKLIMK